MLRLLIRVVCSISLLNLVLPAPAQEEKKLTKVEIGKLGKAATAYVEVPKIGSGTAFCIHPSGLFITNEHVVRGGEKGEITLVLDPSLESQRILKAKVVRMDKEMDLALLRVEGAKDLPSLSLGSIKEVAELAQVVACGFPLGRGLATDRKEYPAISVNGGTVTALRKKGVELQFIQIDVALTFGNSGGPVLDEYGKVIGVVVSGIRNTGINQAIPINQLERFLKTPDLAFSPPDLTPEAMNKPQEFKVRVVSVVPNLPEPSLKLILKAGDEEDREYPMKKQDGVWVATAAPVIKPATSRVEVSARVGTGMVAGTTNDVVFKVGTKPMKLSGVSRIEFQPKPRVVLADGRTIVEGAITLLGTIELELGEQKIKLNLPKATQIAIQLPPEIFTVKATIVASMDGKEISRFETRIPIHSAGTAAPADPSSVAITPPALGDEKVTKRLPELFTAVVAGGGGRYLIFHMPKLKKLAVFDVNEARVTKYIPVTEEDIAFAAGLDSVVIGAKKANKLERWSLTSFELEKSATFKENIVSIIMGYASNGPVVVNGYFLDLNTFRQLPIVDQEGKEQTAIGVNRIASGDGTVFGGPFRDTFVLEGGILKHYRYDGGLGHLIPGPDGKTVFTGRGIVTRTLQRGDPSDEAYGYCVPGLRGDFFLSIGPGSPKGGGGFAVYLRGLKQPVGKLDKAEHGLFLDSGGGDTYAMWRKVFFIPDAKLIVLLPSSNDRVVLYKFDADAALEKSGFDYLLVTSQPPQEVKAGTTLTYPVIVKAKHPEVTFSLDSGPKGMVVSPKGIVTWAVPADTPPGNQDVIMTVKDGKGQEIFHTFMVKVLTP